MMGIKVSGSVDPTLTDDDSSSSECIVGYIHRDHFYYVKVESAWSLYG